MLNRKLVRDVNALLTVYVASISSCLFLLDTVSMALMS